MTKIKYGFAFMSLLLLASLCAADVLVAPGDPIPGDVEGTVLLLAGQHEILETLEITKSLTLTAEPGAVLTSHGDPAIAIHASDVTISNLTLQSADPAAAAIVSGSPVTLVQPSHRVTVISNRIEGYTNGVLHVFGDGFVARDNHVSGVETAAFTTGIMNTMGSDAIIEDNHVSGFVAGVFCSGPHGRVVGNTLSRNNFGVVF
jgi:nitrous oxidase accessory protein NosD